jgi:hypothetical protein
MKLTLDIPNKSLPKILPLIEYIKSLDFIKVKEVDSEIKLSKAQKNELDIRSKTAKVENYIPWDDAKKQLKIKRK